MVNVDEKNIPSEWYLLRTGNVQLMIVIPLTSNDVVIGRNTNLHLRLSSHVSRKHAKLHKTRNGVWYICDLKSTCGLYINKMKVKSEEYLRINDGDIIGLGVSDVTSETDFEFILCRKMYNIRPNRSQMVLRRDVYNKFSLRVKKHKNESLKSSKYKRIKLCASDSDEEIIEYSNLAISIKSKEDNTANKSKEFLENNFQSSDCSTLELKNESFGRENDKITWSLKRNKIANNHKSHIDINNSNTELWNKNVNGGNDIFRKQNITELDHNYVLKKNSRGKINSEKYLNSKKSRFVQFSNFLLENKPDLKVNKSIIINNISKRKMSHHDFMKIRIKRILRVNKKTDIHFRRKRSQIIKNNENINDGNSLTKKQWSITGDGAISPQKNEECLESPLFENKDVPRNRFDKKEYAIDSEKNKTEMKSSQDLEESPNKPSTININLDSELNKLSDCKKEETSELSQIIAISNNSQAYNGVYCFLPDCNLAASLADNFINNSPEVVDEYSENFLSSEYFSNALNFLKVNNSSNSMDKIIAVILYWINEKRNFQIYSDQCKNISLYYNSYEEYFNTYFPLLTLDLLEYIYQSVIGEGNNGFMATITESSITQLVRIKCKIPNNKNLNISDLIRIQIIPHPDTDDQNKYEYGYVTERVPEDFHGKDSLYVIQLLKHNNLILTEGTGIKISTVCNIFSFTQQFEALMFIKESQFLKSILEPNYQCCKIITNPDMEIISSDKYISCQVDAIKNISNTLIESSNNCILMLQTPPGTGKCHTVVGIIQQMLLRPNDKTRILVLSLKETEIEKIATKLHNLNNENIRQVFIGNAKSYFSSEDSKSFYLEETIKRNLNKMPAGLAKNPHLIRNLRKEIVANANITLALFNSLNCDFIDFDTFTCCFVYRAALCTELQTLIPLKCGIKKLLLIGDPEQWSAWTRSKISNHFHVSLFERFYKFFQQSTADNPALMLSRQYLIHPHIISFPSHYFYSNRLKSVNIPNHLPIIPYCIIDLIDVKTRDNLILEIKFIAELCSGISNLLTPDKTVAVLTKHTYQKNKIKNILNGKNNGHGSISVYSFKDREIYSVYDVAIILYSAPHQEDDKTLNILLTRAKSSLILCGYFTAGPNHRFWNALLQDAKSRQLLFKFPPSCGNLAVQSLRKK